MEQQISFLDFSQVDDRRRIKPELPKQLRKKKLTDEEIAQLDRALAMIGLLIDMDMSSEIAGALMSMYDRVSLEQLRYLSGAIVVHRSPWSEDVMGESFRWLRKAIYKDRLEIIVNEIKTDEMNAMAAPSEIIACMYAASMEAPLHREWSDVYLYSCSIALTKHKPMPLREDGTPYESYWEYVGMKDHPIQFKRIKDDYRHLAQDIRRKVVESGKAKGVTGDRPKKESLAKVGQASLGLELE